MMISNSVSSTIQSLSSVHFISGDKVPFSLTTKFSSLSLITKLKPLRTTTIRMGGGPRTFPGGVSKWEWKRMQAKKSRQLLKARLARERQIYEMRKRAEMKVALSELERPWEVVEKAPTLFSVKADEQLKVLADRFQKPGGFDMWSEEDGPELFKNNDGLPSARFFPKGVVHSIKPYGKVEGIGDALDENRGSRLGLDNNGDDEMINWRGVLGGGGNGSSLREKRSDEVVTDGSHENRLRNNVFKKRRNRKSHLNGLEEMSSRKVALDEGNGRGNPREVYNNRDNRMQKISNGSDEMSSRELTLDEGNWRRNARQVYNKSDYRLQNNSNGSEEMSSRGVPFDDENGRRNPRQVYNNREYRTNNSNGSEEMRSREVALNEGKGRRTPGQVHNKREYSMHNSSNGSKEVAWDEGTGSRNPRQVYNKRGYGMQNNSNGSEETNWREVALDKKNSRQNISQVYNKSEYRIQNSSEKLKGSTKAEVYDLRLERDGRYEFRPEI